MSKLTRNILIGIASFIALICIISIAITPIPSDEANDCDCSLVETELTICQGQIITVSNAWDNYMDAFEDYCDIDITNPLCLTIP